MTRIAVLKREEMDAEQGKVFDDAKAAGGPVGGPYWAYIRHPQLMRLAQDISTCLGKGGLSKRERQLSMLATARFWGAVYPWAAQARNALTIGITQDMLDTINSGAAPKLDDPRERLAFDLTNELLANKQLSEATFASATKAFGEKDLVNLIAGIGQFSMTCLTTIAYDCTPTPDMTQKLKG